MDCTVWQNDCGQHAPLFPYRHVLKINEVIARIANQVPPFQQIFWKLCGSLAYIYCARAASAMCKLLLCACVKYWPCFGQKSHSGFYRATLCVSAVFAVARYPSVCPSVTLVRCTQTAEDIVKLLSRAR